MGELQEVSQQKKYGAYYTAKHIAAFLAEWAVRTAQDRVLEPSFGDGVFIEAALERLDTLGAEAGSASQELELHLTGIDLDRKAWERVRSRFPGLSLWRADFFTLDPGGLGRFDAVIGNPPFIRYHHFSGSTRELALERARQNNVAIPALASAWAPFLVHAAAHLCIGGRLAMVAPYEITYAVYARPVVRFLASAFRQVHCLTFEEPLFPELSENAVLLLCDGRGGSTSTIEFHRYRSGAELAYPIPAPATSVPVDGWAGGGIRTSIPQEDLRPIVRRSADLASCGLAFTSEDRDRLTAEGDHLLFDPREPLSPQSAAWVKNGEEQGVPERHKCKVRRPWYKVPGVRAPEMFLSVFASDGPHLVANSAGVPATNSVLVVDRHENVEITPAVVAASSWTTLSRLSAELEGHALGGGALKFEPSEARQWLLPCGVGVASYVVDELNTLLRSGQINAAIALADKAFLENGLGLSSEEIRQLSAALKHLRQLRTRTGRN